MGSKKKKLVLESMFNWLVGKEKFYMNKCVNFLLGNCYICK